MADGATNKPDNISHDKKKMIVMIKKRSQKILNAVDCKSVNT